MVAVVMNPQVFAGTPSVSLLMVALAAVGIVLAVKWAQIPPAVTRTVTGLMVAMGVAAILPQFIYVPPDCETITGIFWVLCCVGWFC